MLTNQDREAIIAQYKRAENDTGSPEVQVALLTICKTILKFTKLTIIAVVDLSAW